MGLMKAAQKVPDAILLPTDFDAYRKYSRLFSCQWAIAPQTEDRGIDEIYIDLTELVAARVPWTTMPAIRVRPIRGGQRARSRAN